MRSICQIKHMQPEQFSVVSMVLRPYQTLSTSAFWTSCARVSRDGRRTQSQVEQYILAIAAYNRATLPPYSSNIMTVQRQRERTIKHIQKGGTRNRAIIHNNTWASSRHTHKHTHTHLSNRQNHHRPSHQELAEATAPVRTLFPVALPIRDCEYLQVIKRKKSRQTSSKYVGLRLSPSRSAVTARNSS
jgi:hypothetical protein